MAIKLAIVGVGKIARDQHLPVLAACGAFDLVAAASRNATVEGVKNFKTLAELLEGAPDVEAVSLCAPPVPRIADARLALSHGKHVLLEKPPGATVSEVHALTALAERAKVSLNASWHSRHAPAVAPARAWLHSRTITSVQIVWKEDVRHWHPGQDWIFQPGGLGVFDPGINALSIVTHILPAFALRSAQLAFPSNRQAPIAAELVFEDVNGAPIKASLDFLQTGQQSWDISIETNDGKLELSKGGAAMRVNAAPVALEGGDDPHIEYKGVYAHFANLVAARRSDVDLAPFLHVADAFMLGDRINAPAFDF